MNVSFLLHKALENTSNQSTYDLTYKKIHSMKEQILNELHLPDTTVEKYMILLDNYKYIEDLNDLREGSYIRWIHVNNTNNNLNRGALYCNLQINSNEVGIICKKIVGSYFTIFNLDEYIFFQKLSDQEIIILNAITNMNNSIQN